ncbi:hypothetical protein [Telluribacter sp.]|jgi:hypothetical protein|nr:hypothetical protein [Telluribacter sp.]
MSDNTSIAGLAAKSENMMFQNMENSQYPWKISPGDRFYWASSLRQ